MDLILTPEDGHLPPLRFSLEEGETVTVGGHGSRASHLWEALEEEFSVRFLVEDAHLFIEQIQPFWIQVEQEEVTRHLLSGGEQLTLGRLACQINLESQELLSLAEEIFRPLTLKSEAKTSTALKSNRWFLKVIAGPNIGAQIDLDEGRAYLIGSDPRSCDVILTDPSVSKRHMKLTVDAHGTIAVEDLKSLNGLLVNGEKVSQVTMQASAILTLGATTLMVIDHNAEQQTVLAPHTTSAPTPSSPEAAAQPAEGALEELPVHAQESALEEVQPSKWRPYLVPVLWLLGVGAIFFSLFSLFNTQKISLQVPPNQVKMLTAVLEEYPYFEYFFNDSTGVLTLTGHILTVHDKRQLLSHLANVELLRKIDDTHLVVDEIVTQQFNLAMEKSFPGIKLTASVPGEFILTGVLSTVAQSQHLQKYLEINFPYSERLQNHVMVIEELMTMVNRVLNELAPSELMAKWDDGQIIFLGTLPSTRALQFHQLVEQLKTLPGIRQVQLRVVEQNGLDDEGMIDISSSYKVTGFSKSQDAASTSVMINGRILQRGDTLDGMTLVSIRPKTVVLDRDGIKYKVHYAGT